MKKGKAAKKAAIAVVTAVAVGGVSVGGYYGIRQAQKTTVKVYPVSDFTSGYWGDSMNMEDHFPGSRQRGRCGKCRRHADDIRYQHD